MTRFRPLLLGLTIAPLCVGCASAPFGNASAGGAVYRYSHTTAEGALCSVEISSAREVASGTINVGPECTMTTEAENLGGSAEAFATIRALVGRLPEAP